MASAKGRLASLRRLDFAGSLVDHAIHLPGNRFPAVEAAHGTEVMVGIEIEAQGQAEAEAPRLAVTNGAEVYPLIRNRRSSSARLPVPHATLREASTMKRVMAFCASASRSRMVRLRIGWSSRPLASSHAPISFAASRVTWACHSSSVTGLQLLSHCGDEVAGCCGRRAGWSPQHCAAAWEPCCDQAGATAAVPQRAASSARH